jgi:aspartyl aminopeptidase
MTVPDIVAFLSSSPTPMHAATNAGNALSLLGWTEAREWTSLPRRGWMRRGGSLLAWRLPEGAPVTSLAVLGAHTDSPNLRLHPRPDQPAGPAGTTEGTLGLLGVEIYGGVLLNSWLNRDLGVAGSVHLRDGTERLFVSPGPVAMIPQLAIHLDREVGERGLVLDRHLHMRAIWTAQQRAGSYLDWLAATVGCEPDSILAHDSQLFDVQPPARIGADGSLLASARLDNQASCWAALGALVDTDDRAESAAVVVLNDHEEVGSGSVTGAAGPMLEHFLSCVTEGLTAGERVGLIARSRCLSMDNAHGVHPNHPDRHDPGHAPRLGAGPVLKINANQRYATGPAGAARLTRVAADADVPLQTFVSRNNIPCGSTIGPITATRTGIDTIDVGVPQLSMHSVREVCAHDDIVALRRLAGAFLADRAD